MLDGDIFQPTLSFNLSELKPTAKNGDLVSALGVAERKDYNGNFGLGSYQIDQEGCGV